MHVLVATKETQGRRDNDFSFVPEGELIKRPSTCSNGTADDSCGCSRALSGVACHQSTTTVKVADIPGFTATAYKDILLASEENAGWFPSDETIAKEAHVLLDAADDYEVGDVLEYRDGIFSKRLK